MNNKRILSGLLASLASLSFSGGCSHLALGKVKRKPGKLHSRGNNSGVMRFVKENPMVSLFATGEVGAFTTVAFLDYMLNGSVHRGFIEKVWIPLVYKELEKKYGKGVASESVVEYKYRFWGNKILVVKQSDRNDEKVVRDFESERMMFRKFSSLKGGGKDHLARIVDVHRGLVHNFVVYERADGFDIRDLIDRYKKNEWGVGVDKNEFVRKVCKQLIEVVRCLYKAGLHHGDLHGRNFVISAGEDGSNPSVHVFDFGRVFEHKDSYDESDISSFKCPSLDFFQFVGGISYCFDIFGNDASKKFVSEFNKDNDLRQIYKLVKGWSIDRNNGNNSVEKIKEAERKIKTIGGSGELINKLEKVVESVHI